MPYEWTRPLLGLGLLATGSALALVGARARSHGWLGILLVSIPAFCWLAADKGPHSGVFSLLLFSMFLLTGPAAVVYAFRCEVRAPDRAAAGVAFFLSLMLGILLLFTVAGLVQSLWITRPGAPSNTIQRMGTNRASQAVSCSQWRLGPTADGG